MLVVDPDRRFTIDQCLAHPWMLADTPAVNDSTNGLVSGVAGLDVSRRGVTRERTLLSSVNTVQVTGRVPMGPNRPDLKIYSKNPRAAPSGSASPAPRKEVRPSDGRDPREFMENGGKGDQELYGNDTASRYSKNDLAAAQATAAAAAAKKGKGKGKSTR
jgi:serine/threonine-protein kinase Chk2